MCVSMPVCMFKCLLVAEVKDCCLKSMIKNSRLVLRAVWEWQNITHQSIRKSFNIQHYNKKNEKNF